MGPVLEMLQSDVIRTNIPLDVRNTIELSTDETFIEPSWHAFMICSARQISKFLERQYIAISLKLANLVGLTFSIQILELGTFTVPSGHTPLSDSGIVIKNTKIKQQKSVEVILLSISILVISQCSTTPNVVKILKGIGQYYEG
jgi:hypothetical protein